MTNQQNHEANTVTENYTPAPWFDECLQLTADYAEFCREEAPPLEPEFRQRCLATVDAARALAKLREQATRSGFLPLSLTDFLQQLAVLASVRLAEVWAHFGLSEAMQPTSENAQSFARLALTLGLSLRQTLAHVRIGLATQWGEFAPTLFAAHRRMGTAITDPLLECEHWLTQIEADYDQAAWREWRQIEMESRAVFAAAESDQQ